MFKTILEKIAGFAGGLSLNFWLYSIIGVLVLCEQFYVYHRGYQAAIVTVDKSTAKAQKAENEKQAERAKTAVKDAGTASDAVANQEEQNKKNEDSAHEVSKANDCPKSDAEREFLRQRIDEANKHK